MSYPEVFLATYRYFLYASELLNALKAWFYAEEEAPAESPNPNLKVTQGVSPNIRRIRSRVVKVLLAWINNHWNDFQNEKTLFDDVNSFADDLASYSFIYNQKLVHAIREQVDFIDAAFAMVYYTIYSNVFWRENTCGWESC
jgi:hypothetical protein